MAKAESGTGLLSVPPAITLPELLALLARRLCADETNVMVMPEAESRAAYYREQGRQLRALVSLVISAEVKAELLELAERFERLAAQAEHAAQT